MKPNDYIEDDIHGGTVRVKTAVMREFVWEVLDEMTPGVVFKSRDIWLKSRWVHYGQVIIVLLHAQRLGLVERVAYARYRIPSGE